MFDLTLIESDSASLLRYRIAKNGARMNFQDVLDAWSDDESFREFFSTSISDSPFKALRWETPPLSRGSLERDFEFALIDSPRFCDRPTDSKSFEAQFCAVQEQQVITFQNLGGDATMIVPVPLADDEHYGHLVAFLGGAPSSQVHSLWQTVARRVLAQVSDVPIWLSTAGGGVAWLHVRIDSRPKYYNYAPYRNPEF